MAAESNYEEIAQELKRRILALIPKHPQILGMTDPTDLRKVAGFKSDDLNPSRAQAAAALDVAKKEFCHSNPID